jgi:hypothetical protein
MITKEMDLFMNKTFINLYSIAKRNNETIILKDFDPKNIEHLYLLEVAQVVNNFFRYKIILNMPLYKKFFNKKFWKIKVKRKVKSGINIDEFLTFTSKNMEIDVKSLYKELYEKN